MVLCADDRLAGWLRAPDLTETALVSFSPRRFRVAPLRADMVESTSSPPTGAGEAPETALKLDASSGDFSEAEMQRAIKAGQAPATHEQRGGPACPVFRPTSLDPFAYIKSITPEGQAAGIVKIIPPEGASDGIPVVPPPRPPPTRRELRPTPMVMANAFSKPKTNTENTERAPSDHDGTTSRFFLTSRLTRDRVRARPSRLSRSSLRVRLCYGIPSGWKPAFDATAGGEGVPFETKLQTINRLQEGLHFSDGARYDRDSYKKMADAFAAAYDAKHPEFAARAERARRGAAGPLGAESTDPADTAADQRNGDADARLEAEARVVQEEFWRVVETDVESVRVEYGSDLDADVYGTGVAATVPPIGDPRTTPSHHAWDFNELIHHPSNLLRVVGSDVPGLTRPWLYFGMLFSAFCWHVEDHYLGSVNYLHAGAPKTWYGIPSASADAFEDAVRVMVPGLLDAAPDLLHRLVTLVPPLAGARRRGVPASAEAGRVRGDLAAARTTPDFRTGTTSARRSTRHRGVGHAGRSAVEGTCGAWGRGRRLLARPHGHGPAQNFARRLNTLSGESGGVVLLPGYAPSPTRCATSSP